jgi:predicted GH43/DUF377 family glycosyl hydrolase
MKKLILLISIFGLSVLIPNFMYSQIPKFPFYGYDSNPVLVPSTGEWDGGCTFLASPFYYDGIFYLYYAGSMGNPILTQVSIGYAISDDGFNFVKWDLPVLEADETGFDSLGVGKCKVIEVDGEFRMYYNGIDLIPSPGPGTAIGYATAPDPTGPWTRLEDPVLSSGSFGEWDAGCLEPQAVIEVDSGFLMFYFGIHSLPINDNGCIGMAYSEDGLTWEKYDDPSTTSMPYAESDPVLMPGEAGSWDETTFLGCSVIKSYNELQMFYTGIDNDGDYGIGYATSTNGYEWTKDYSIDPYTYLDDPYADEHNYYVVEEPGVIFNEDTSHYYMYYDYGLTVGEIGMATAPNLTMSTKEIDKSNSELNCSIYPNPSCGIVNCQLSIVDCQSVSINIYNLQGREVANILDKEIPAGDHQISWDAKGMSAGVYFVRITSEDGTINRKIVIY